jgi:hypothetical protein
VYTIHRKKTNTTKTQHRKLKRLATWTPPETGVYKHGTSFFHIHDTLIWK